MFPVPENIDGLDVVFGSIKHVPKFNELSEEFQRGRHPCCDIAQSLFFKGGKLADYGLTPKAGVDASKAFAAVRALLVSFEPKHEHKIAAAGYMLSEWYDRDATKQAA